jgi:hypothetical protein
LSQLGEVAPFVELRGIGRQYGDRMGADRMFLVCTITGYIEIAVRVIADLGE